MVPLCLWSTGWQGENSWLSSVSSSSSFYPFPLFPPAYLLPFLLCLLFPGNVTCFHGFNCYFYTKNFRSVWPGFLLYWFACLRFLLRCIKFNIQASSVQMDYSSKWAHQLKTASPPVLSLKVNDWHLPLSHSCQRPGSWLALPSFLTSLTYHY